MTTAPSPQTTCPQCNGTGWRPETATAQADNKPRPQRVVRCECKLAQSRDKLLQQADIPRRYANCSISNYDLNFEGAHQSLASARLAAGRFVEEYPIDETGLMLVGPIGVGKTHLAVGVLRELVAQKGVPCLFCDYRELLKKIQNSYNPMVQTTELEVLKPVFEAEVLVLDELGAVRPTEWVWDTVSLVLNTRYNEKRTTIITTNYADLPPGGLDDTSGKGQSWNTAKYAAREETLGDRIGERMRSRLHEMCRIITMQGADHRLQGPGTGSKQ